VDLAVAMLGRPEQVTPFLKSTPGLPGGIRNNCLAVLEYPRAIATLRACSMEVGGLENRRLKICGTNGTIDLCPLERFDGKPLQMRLALIEGNGEYSAGSHIIDFGIRYDRYEEQLLELAKIVNGEVENSYIYEHDYLVQEVLLAAADYTKWNK
jgi:predicted dehydrogenase